MQRLPALVEIFADRECLVSINSWRLIRNRPWPRREVFDCFGGNYCSSSKNRRLGTISNRTDNNDSSLSRNGNHNPATRALISAEIDILDQTDQLDTGYRIYDRSHDIHNHSDYSSGSARLYNRMDQRIDQRIDQRSLE